MSERDPFERLGELIDQPAAPDARFAADLKSRLMSGLAASGRTYSWEEEQQPVDIPYSPPLVSIPEQTRRFRPLILLEIAAVAALLIGIAAAIGSGIFSSDPDDPATIPAAALQGDSAATPTSPPPTVVPPSGAEEGREASPISTMEPTVAPPDDLLWELPLPEEERAALDAGGFGGMTLSDGVIYRLLDTLSFSGVEAVDGATGTVLWRAQYDYWDGYGVLADREHVYFLWRLSAESSIVALDAASGEEAWTLELDEFLVGKVLQNGVIFVEDNRNTLKAIQDGEVLWEQPIDPNYDESRPMGNVYAINDPVTNEETVVAMSETGIISAFDIVTGDRKWASNVAYLQDTRLTISEDTLVLFQGLSPEVPGAEGTPAAVSGEVVDDQLSVQGAPWMATGLNLEDGSQRWQRGVANTVSQLAKIGDTVAYIVFQGEPDGSATPVTPHNTILYGLDSATGEVFWSVRSEDSFFVWPGTWITDTGGQGLFVVANIEVGGDGKNADDIVVSDPALTAAEPHSQGRTEGIEIDVDLEEAVISPPLGDEHGLYLTLEDGTLVAVSPSTLLDDD